MSPQPPEYVVIALRQDASEACNAKHVTRSRCAKTHTGLCDFAHAGPPTIRLQALHRRVCRWHMPCFTYCLMIIPSVEAGC